jgi:galactose mutarotase-like enzyme
VIDSGADAKSARLAAELDFGAAAELLAAFPFPHLLRIEVRLEQNVLTIRTTVTPNGDTPVPIAFGYHPYLRIPEVPREDWEIALPIRQRLLLDERMIPTGRREKVESPRGPLGVRAFDDGFTDLLAGEPFIVSGGERAIAVSFVERYPFAQVYSPPGAAFICFEPMTAPTNALASSADLPVVSPGESFSALFAITVSNR